MANCDRHHLSVDVTVLPDVDVTVQPLRPLPGSGPADGTDLREGESEVLYNG